MSCRDPRVRSIIQGETGPERQACFCVVGSRVARCVFVESWSFGTLMFVSQQVVSVKKSKTPSVRNNFDKNLTEIISYRFAFFSFSLFPFLTLLVEKDALKITEGCPSCTDPSIPVKKICTHVLDSLVRTAKKKRGAVGTSSTRADACAFASDPQLSSRRRRFQTGETPEKQARMFRLLGQCPETLQRNLHTC